MCPPVFSLSVSAYEDFVQESSLVNALRIVETLSGSHMSRQYPPSFPDVDGAVQAETNLSQVKKCGIISHFQVAKITKKDSRNQFYSSTLCVSNCDFLVGWTGFLIGQTYYLTMVSMVSFRHFVIFQPIQPNYPKVSHSRENFKSWILCGNRAAFS